MTTVHNTIRFTSNDGVNVNINIATISYVETDLENGFIVSGISSATEIYKLAQLYHTKTLYINDLVGLQITFSETTLRHYYADPYLKEPIPAYDVTFKVFNGTTQVASRIHTCVPSNGFLDKKIGI